MAKDIGEYMVGAYLQLFKNCNIVNYDVRISDGGMAGLNEIDVIGVDSINKKAYLCEVTTHIRGATYGNKAETSQKILDKYHAQRAYAQKYLRGFDNSFMFWSPAVGGRYKEHLSGIRGLEKVINQDYSRCVDKLRKKAKKMTNDIGNPSFRMLQIIEHLRR